MSVIQPIQVTVQIKSMLIQKIFIINNVGVDVESTSLNINKQSTKSLTNYTKSIINMHKWHISPPEYAMVDLKCGGSPITPNQGQAYLIIYGIKDNHSDVPADVYDSPFIF